MEMGDLRGPLIYINKRQMKMQSNLMLEFRQKTEGPSTLITQNRFCHLRQEEHDDDNSDDIINANKINEEENEEQKEEKAQQKLENLYFARMRKYFGRIQVENADDGVNWKCAMCPYQRQKQGSLRNHLSVMHRRAKTGKVTCPYCNKQENRIGNLKNAHTWLHWKKM